MERPISSLYQEEEDAAARVIMSEDEIRNQVFLNGPPPEEGEKKEKVKLKEPRDLYSTASLQHMPKWPIECQVIPEKVRHRESISSKPEPFHVPSNVENQPKPVGEEMGTVIYHYQPRLSVDYFCRACAGGSEDLQFFDTDANTLKFESRFESGNLCKAIKVTNVYYELYLRPDMYTERHSQWFYFRVQNTKENIVYRFSIVNLSKPDSLYRYGLKPLMYSEKEAQLNNVGWVRCGHNISYFKNDLMADDNNSYYTLTFTLRFRHANDTVFIAQCYPYTYTKLQNYLAEIEANENKSEFYQQRLLCRSLAGNNVYVLTITSPDNYSQENTKKPVIVISARVHPGETQSSYMMKGIIDFLTSNFRQAKDLRDRFIFKLIPMLNPDGVIVGNSRCCLLGQDLNRQYRTVLREAFPQIYHTKVMMRRLMEENGIYLYCDLHGHSRRNNVFMYGCENKRVPEKRLTEQVFPLMMQKNAADKFSFQNCKFKIQRSKEGTGRVFAWTLGVHLSYTIEISLGGSTQPSRPQTHFNASDYEAVGRHFCETLLDYSDTSPEKERLKERILQKLQENGSTADEPTNVPISDYSSLSHSETEESSDENEAKTASKKNTKRKNSIRRQNSMPARTAAHHIRHKPKERPKLLKLERSVLSISKASVAAVVEEVRAASVKVRRLEENNETNSRKVAANKDEELEDSLARLSRFKRRSKRVAFRMPSNDKASTAISFLSTRCTSILFDDPFNPPSRDGAHNNKLVSVDEFTRSSHSFSEDECDDSDGAFKNRRYFPSATVITPKPEDIITEDLAQLKLSPNEKRLEPVVESAVAIPASVSDASKSAKVKVPLAKLDAVIKPERRRFSVLEKQKAVEIERPRSKSTTFIEISEHTQLNKKFAWKPSTGKDTNYRSQVTFPSSNHSLSQRRVSWTGSTGTSSAFLSRSQARLKTGEINSSSTKKESTHRRNSLKKSKSVGDKLDETGTHIGEIHHHAASKKKKKKHKKKGKK